LDIARQKFRRDNIGMKNLIKTKRLMRRARHRRVRAKIFGTSKKPRLCVFRSNSHIYAQLIDDSAGRTLAAASDLNIKSNKSSRKLDLASAVGEMLAKRAKEMNIKKAVFDRGGFAYHGRVRALADAARKAGLEF
jgi:large subunit ribosomal protein L18